ncbi:hypothetical protein KAU32_10315 [bacterium]|nr:hypothetical protein [bacterium]
MKKEDIIFTNERERRVYLMSIEKILNFKDSKVKRSSMITSIASAVAFLSLVFTLFFATGVIPGRHVEDSTQNNYVEYDVEFSERYAEFFSLTESSDTSDIYGDLFSNGT